MKKIVYIVSDTRSGTTLLENLLSKSSKALSVGELDLLGDYLAETGSGKEWGYVCSCGKKIKACDFWVNNLGREFLDRLTYESSTKFNYRLSKKNSIRYMFSTDKTRRVEHLLGRCFKQDVANNVALIFDKIFAQNNIRSIIDSSKRPWQVYHYSKNLNYDVKVIYLERDIRSVVLSKVRWEGKSVHPIYRCYANLLASYVYRSICLKIVGMFEDRRVLKIKYETLSKNHKKVIKDIIAFMDEKESSIPDYMYGGDSHTIAGTPNRFTVRPIKYDEKWMMTMKRKPLFSLVGNMLQNIRKGP